MIGQNVFAKMFGKNLVFIALLFFGLVLLQADAEYYLSYRRRRFFDDDWEYFPRRRYSDMEYVPRYRYVPVKYVRPYRRYYLDY